MESARAVELATGASTRRVDIRERTALIASIAAYAVIAAALVWSRYAKLGHGLWHDEIFTVVHFVHGGPRAIFFGDYLPNNHMLFSLLAWLTQLVSPAELALRLPSVLPFFGGAAIVTAWLDRRVGRLPALIYFGLVTASPLLLDISPEARGYGLTFLAMSALIVVGDESIRDPARWRLVAFCAAGVAGTWTLPIFGVAFAAIGLALAVRVRGLVWYLAGSAVAVAAWYAPVATELVSSSDQEFGERLAWHGILTGPFEHLLVPALIGGYVFGVPGFVASVVLAAICASSPLLRDRLRALLLLAGPAATFLVVWTGGLYVAARFISYLLVPGFILLVTGSIRVVQRARRRGPLVRVPVTAAMVTAAGLMVFIFGIYASIESRFPREAHREAAAFIRRAAPGARVGAYMARPGDLAYYLGRPVIGLSRPSDVSRWVCRDVPAELVLVVQLYRRPPLDEPCLQRTTHKRFRQYARGGAIDVWLLPRQAKPG